MSEIESIPFVSFDKIARLNRHMTVTEKIDGTNAQIHFTEDGRMLVGSRTRWITPDDDNFGFARWAKEHEEDLKKLGPGSHYGEWWGSGIQRRYDMQEKRFSLFNTARWTDETKPACCHLVPVLYNGPFSQNAILDCLEKLRINGSAASAGFKKPEGVVVYLAAARTLFKVTLEKDEEPKGFGQKEMAT